MGKNKAEKERPGQKGAAEKKNVLSRRLRRFFILFFLFPVIGVSALYYIFSVRALSDEAANMMLRSLSYMQKHVASQFLGIAETSQAVLYASYPYINREPGLDTLSRQIDDISSLNTIIDSYEGRNMMNRMYLYVSDQKVYAKQRKRFYPLSDLGRETLARYDEAFENGKYVLWEGPLFSDDAVTETRHWSIRCVSLIRNTNNFNEFAGILCVEILQTELQSILDAGLSYGETVFLMDEDGVILSHPDSHQISSKTFTEQQINTMMKAHDGVLRVQTDEGTELVAYVQMDFPSWFIVIRVSEAVIFERSLYNFFIGGVVVFLVFLALMMGASYFLYVQLLQDTIQRISDTVSRLMREGVELIQVEGQPFPKGSELSVLEKNVEKFIKTMQSMMEEKYRMEISKKETLLQLLQSQINPHFLYNTLDLIKWKILDNDKEMGIRMINELSCYFRMSLNTGKDIITLNDELNLIKAYLNIQSIRFEGRFSTVFDIDKSAVETKIPKFSIQPFVENALIHGMLERRNTNGLLRIVIKRTGEDIFISVIDNGVGMDKETLQRIETGAAKGSSFGIFNVKERIRLFYGDAYGISIKSCPEVGTTVTLHIRYR